jgi:hypothetical protein
MTLEGRQQRVAREGPEGWRTGRRAVVLLLLLLLVLPPLLLLVPPLLPLLLLVLLLSISRKRRLALRAGATCCGRLCSGGRCGKCTHSLTR